MKKTLVNTFRLDFLEPDESKPASSPFWMVVNLTHGDGDAETIKTFHYGSDAMMFVAYLELLRFDKAKRKSGSDNDDLRTETIAMIMENEFGCAPYHRPRVKELNDMYFGHPLNDPYDPCPSLWSVELWGVIDGVVRKLQVQKGSMAEDEINKVKLNR